MADVLVLCGGTKHHGASKGRLLELNIDAPEGSPSRVNFKPDHLTTKMMEVLPNRMADLLEIACYVYCADQFTGRGNAEFRNLGAAWRRRFKFKIPVRDIDHWRRKDVVNTIVETLSYLSEDVFEFEFVGGRGPAGLEPYLNLQDGAPAGFQPEKVILFSGGLDSLSGAIEVQSRGERAALVSHHGSPMIWGKQLELVRVLRERVQPGHLFHVSVGVNSGPSDALEFTQRTRSFLFATIGLVVARLFRKTEITFFENGIVSVNLPVARHVIGARATRTTHPRVLADFSRLFSLVAEEEIRVINPFLWKTKADVVGLLATHKAADLISTAFSCTRVRNATHTKRHCGRCSQCVDRRFAVLANQLGDYESPELYAIDLFAGPRKPGRDLTFIESYVLTAQRFIELSEVAFAAKYGETPSNELVGALRKR